MEKTQLEKELWGRNWGLEESAKAHAKELEDARRMAKVLAAGGHEITIDDIRQSLPHLEYGNWCGSIFLGKDWICSGYTQAKHKNSHCRIIKKWKLKTTRA